MKVQKLLLSTALCLLLLSGCAKPSSGENVSLGTTPVTEHEITVPTVTPAGPQDTDHAPAHTPTDTPTDTPQDTPVTPPAAKDTPTPPVAAPTKKATPTPVAVTVPTDIPEEEATEETLHAPRFSKGGGFYNDAFQLTLSGEEGATIYYTTDGTDPRTSVSAKRYTGSIRIYNNTDEPNVYSMVTDISLNGYWPPDYNIDKGINVRAVLKLADGTFGPVVTNSYFVGKSASYYSNLRVISLMTDADNLFDPDTGAYMVGTKYYEWKNSREAVAYDPSDVQNPTNYNSDGKKSEFPVTIQVFENGTPVFTSDVGARISGNWSRSSTQKSLRFYARKELSGESKMKYAFFEDMTDYEGNVISKFDKVTLRNGGGDSLLHFRDAFIQDLASDLAVDTMNSQPYILFINGEFWGLYMLREKPEDYYIQSHYGIDDKEVTVIKNGILDSGKEESLEEYRNFCRWVSTADMTNDADYKKFCEQMDLQSFMDYMAIETYINNSDWATGYMNNWMVWRSEIIDPSLEKADKKWRFILYDMDNSSGIWDNEPHSPYYDSLGTIGAEWADFNLPAMLKNLCRNEEFRTAFYENYLSVIENCFDYEKVEAHLSKYTALLKDVTLETQYRFGNGWAAYGYDDNAEAFLRFFKIRPEYAKKYVEIYCGLREAESTFTLTETREFPVADWWYWGGADFYTDYKNGSLHAHVPEILPNIWEAQAGFSGLTFEEGYRYQVSFDASCSGEGTFQVIVNRKDDNGNYPTITVAALTLDEELSHYNCIFIHTLESNTDFSLAFNFAGSTGDFVVTNVTVSKVE